MIPSLFFIDLLAALWVLDASWLALCTSPSETATSSEGDFSVCGRCGKVCTDVGTERP